MPKKKEDKGDVMKAWEAHVAAYKAANPVKFAAKKEAGEFDEIPATFMPGDQLVNYDT
jgi:hypothetical protein